MRRVKKEAEKKRRIKMAAAPNKYIPSPLFTAPNKINIFRHTYSPRLIIKYILSRACGKGKGGERVPKRVIAQRAALLRLLFSQSAKQVFAHAKLPE